MTETDVMILLGHGADSTCLLPSREGGHQPQVSHTLQWVEVTPLPLSHTTCPFKSALKGPLDT